VPSGDFDGFRTTVTEGSDATSRDCRVVLVLMLDSIFGGSSRTVRPRSERRKDMMTGGCVCVAQCRKQKPRVQAKLLDGGAWEGPIQQQAEFSKSKQRLGNLRRGALGEEIGESG
jgi:hypothetical protein